MATLIWIARHGAVSATPMILVAGVVLTVVGGLTNTTALGRSQVPTTLDTTTARLLVALVLGAGVGLVASAAGRLRTPVVARPNRHT